MELIINHMYIQSFSDFLFWEAQDIPRQFLSDVTGHNLFSQKDVEMVMKQ